MNAALGSSVRGREGTGSRPGCGLTPGVRLPPSTRGLLRRAWARRDPTRRPGRDRTVTEDHFGEHCTPVSFAPERVAYKFSPLSPPPPPGKLQAP